jgi:hypothetical protein
VPIISTSETIAMPHKNPRYEFVVSGENNSYIAWQAMLFHYSCLKHTGSAPLVVVHGDMKRRLVRGFEAMRRHGGRIQRVPNFRRHRGIDYAPRNTPGTLHCVESDADYLVLCDADMIFFGPSRFDRHRLADDQIGLDRVTYMTINDESRSFLAAACKRAGVSLKRLATAVVGGGVPHIIPRSLQPELSCEWLRSLEFFFPRRASTRTGNSIVPASDRLWTVGMWALILATYRLGLRSVITGFALSNFGGDRNSLPATPDGNPFLIHYCYGDSIFNKRDFFGKAKTCDRVWQVRRTKVTLSGQVCNEIAAARAFFGLETAPRRDA